MQAPPPIIWRETYYPHIFHKEIRRDVFKTCGCGVLITIGILIICLSIISMQLGASWNPTGYTSNVDIAIVNNDQNTIGNTLQGALMNTTVFNWKLDNSITNPPQFIQNAGSWVVLTIPANFTKNYYASLQLGAPYKQSVVLTYDQGRHFNGISVITRVLQAVLILINKGVAFKTLSTVPLNTSRVDMSVLRSPISFSEVNINPVSKSGLDNACSLCLMYLFLLSIAGLLFSLILYLPLIGKIPTWQIFLLRKTYDLINTFVVSCGIAVVLVWFGAEFKYTFWAYWMFMWLVMFCYFHIMELVIMIMRTYTVFVSPIIMIFMFATSAAVMPNELQSPFYSVGRGFPMYHAVKAARHILFGSDGTELGLNLGVLIIYSAFFFVVNSLLFFYGDYLRRKAAVKAATKKVEDANKIKSDTGTTIDHHDEHELLESTVDHDMTTDDLISDTSVVRPADIKRALDAQDKKDEQTNAEVLEAVAQNAVVV
ncbi:hypothetical protein AKO1_007389 [Acrasis kona]|uniref:DUF3533 domain-containing protein n=1 Tax=Acrasis kona TaxID=1008807 RepID=A0AAW2YTC7_9EUKA